MSRREVNMDHARGLVACSTAEELAELVATLIELARTAGGSRGFFVSADGSELRSVKYPDDAWCPGYPFDCLAAIAVVTGDDR